MKIIDKSRPVMVTGGTGYMASWIIKMLLEKGIDVNATVRDLSDVHKVEHLARLAQASPGRLKLFEADLLDFDCFDEPMQGCELVIHTASPCCSSEATNPEEELVRPTKEGIRNILETAKRTRTVKRIVLTSSVLAVYGDSADIRSAPSGRFTEKEWNATSSLDHQSYPYSKTIGEKEAWVIAEGQDQWDMITINPGWILGPSITKRTDSTSIGLMIKFGDGSFKTGILETWHGIVDVRDVASAHIKAGFTPGASGRHILVSGEARMLDIANILRKYFGEGYPFPRRQVRKSIFWLFAPKYGYTRKYVSRNVGIPIKFDNSYSKADLEISYIPIEQTVKEHFQQILDDNLFNPEQTQSERAMITIANTTTL